MIERVLDFTVRGQRIVYAGETPEPVGDTVGHLVAAFDVDAAWGGLTLMAVFGNREGKTTVQLDADLRCAVPPEAIAFGARKMTVGLIGRDADGDRLTTDEAVVRLDPSCYRPGKTPPPPPRDLYGEFLAGLRDAVAAAESAAADADSAERSAESAKAFNETAYEMITRVGELYQDLSGALDEFTAEADRMETSAAQADAAAAESAASATEAERIARSVREDADSGKFNGAPGPRGETGPAGPSYTLPVATDKALGGVMLAAKTDEMTERAGVDTEGRVWVKPGGSGSGGEVVYVTATSLNEDGMGGTASHGSAEIEAAVARGAAVYFLFDPWIAQYFMTLDGLSLFCCNAMDGAMLTEAKLVVDAEGTFQLNFVENYIPSTPDMAQNDETAPDYIKNRTHWKEETYISCGVIVGEAKSATVFEANMSGDNDSVGRELSGLFKGVGKADVAVRINGAQFDLTMSYDGETYNFSGDVLGDGEDYFTNKFVPGYKINLTFKRGAVFLLVGELSVELFSHNIVYAQLDSGYVPIGASLEIVDEKIETKIGKPGTGNCAEIFNFNKNNTFENNTASGYYSHAEGRGTKASGYYSHAEGDETTASGNSSHAEGNETTASGNSSHAEGNSTTASGNSSHAEGDWTIANGKNRGVHAQGEYNIDQGADGTLIHIVGNGSFSGGRSNAHTLDHDGTAWFAGDVFVGSASGTNMDEGSRRLVNEEELWGELDGFDQYLNESLGLFAQAVEEYAEAKENKVTSITGEATDEQYPSAKAVADYVAANSGGESARANAFAVTLTDTGWSNGAQAVSNTLFAESGYVYMVQPAGNSYAEYGRCLIYADDVTENGRMTFHCHRLPGTSLTVNVLRMEAAR